MCRNVRLSAVALACLLAMPASESRADASTCPAQIPFGLTTALTGNLALLGTQARNGAEFAVDEINAARRHRRQEDRARDRRHRRISAPTR